MIYIKVKFYFTSGQTLDIDYSKEKWQEIQDHLKTNWKETNTIGSIFGINFSLVTHYVVMESK